MKLKKSLLIVPAMATLLFAAAGSVGGTVAWFSAVSTFDTKITSFKVVRLDGDLACVMGEGVGTDVSAGKVVLEANTELTHGSYDHTSKNVYVTTGSDTSFASKAVLSDDAATAASGDLLATSYIISGASHKVYYAVTWSMAFTYSLPVSGASSGQATNLYLDLVNSSFTSIDGGQSESLFTKKGFRVAFFPNTAEDMTTSTNDEHYTRVWADLEESAKCSYVSSASTTSAYTSGSDASSKVLISSADTAVIPEGEKGTKNLNYCLGQFKGFTTGASKLGYTCVAWFEGSDENVKNAASMDEVTVNLAFYTRTSSD